MESSLIQNPCNDSRMVPHFLLLRAGFGKPVRSRGAIHSFRQWHILDVRGDVPDIAKRVVYAPAAITIGRVRGREFWMHSTH
jgi:hypothetical protein